MGYRFTWDAQKAVANFRKHGVSFERALLVFRDSLAVSVPDERHPERWITSGEVDGRLIVVVHVDVEDVPHEGESPRASSRRGAQPDASAMITVDAKDVRALAAVAPPITTSEEIDLSDIPETDFSQPNAVRGKNHARFHVASGLVQLAPDVRHSFADDEAVNRALRHVLELAKDVRSGIESQDSE